LGLYDSGLLRCLETNFIISQTTSSKTNVNIADNARLDILAARLRNGGRKPVLI